MAPPPIHLFQIKPLDAPEFIRGSPAQTSFAETGANLVAAASRA